MIVLEMRSGGKGAVCVICLLREEEEKPRWWWDCDAGGESVDNVVVDADEDAWESEVALERWGAGDGRGEFL